MIHLYIIAYFPVYLKITFVWVNTLLHWPSHLYTGANSLIATFPEFGHQQVYNLHVLFRGHSYEVCLDWGKSLRLQFQLCLSQQLTFVY